MPIKFNRAKMRIKDNSGNYTSVIDVLTTLPMGDYIRLAVQPWIDGTDGVNAISSTNPAYNNNALYYKNLAQAAMAQTEIYHNNLSNFTETAQTNLVNSLGQEYSATSPYKIGQIVLYEGKLYMCGNLIDSNGQPDFTSDNWIQINLGNEHANLKRNLKALGVEWGTGWKILKDANNQYFGFRGKTVGNYLGNDETTPPNNWNINLTTSKGSTLSYTYMTTYALCLEGDIIFTNAKGGSGDTLYPSYGFISENGKILKIEAYTTSSSTTHKKAVATDFEELSEPVKYVYINNRIDRVSKLNVYFYIIKKDSLMYKLYNLISL